MDIEVKHSCVAEAERNQAVTLAQTNAEKRILEGLREVDTARRDAAVEILEAEADAVRSVRYVTKRSLCLPTNIGCDIGPLPSTFRCVQERAGHSRVNHSRSHIIRRQ